MLINGGKKKKVWRGKNRMGFIKPAAVAVVDEVGPSLRVAWYVGRKSWELAGQGDDVRDAGARNKQRNRRPRQPTSKQSGGFSPVLVPP